MAENLIRVSRWLAIYADPIEMKQDSAIFMILDDVDGSILVNKRDIPELIKALQGMIGNNEGVNEPR